MLVAWGALLLVPGCAAQDPLQRYPQNYKLVLDNRQLAVIRVHYGPHETVGVHDHSDLPTLFVYLNDSGRVRFHIEDIPPTVTVRPPAKLGSFRYSPGRVERHTVENLSDVSSDFLRIELKQFPLHGGEVFRHDAPASLGTSRTESEFSNEELEVERVICATGASCTVEAANEPSILVALAPVTLSDAGHAFDEMRNGDVRWIEPGEQATASAPVDAPAQLLRVLVKSPKPAAPVSWRPARAR